jgi:hypothetical protein
MPEPKFKTGQRVECYCEHIWKRATVVGRSDSDDGTYNYALMLDAGMGVNESRERYATAHLIRAMEPRTEPADVPFKPRRSGRVQEWQDGHYFLYVTEWDADGKGQHIEVEVYFAKARLLWMTTDPRKIMEAKALFFENPMFFEQPTHRGELPKRITLPVTKAEDI